MRVYQVMGIGDPYEPAFPATDYLYKSLEDANAVVEELFASGEWTSYDREKGNLFVKEYELI